jgi:para-nitrobenzyl esterase
MEPRGSMGAPSAQTQTDGVRVHAWYGLRHASAERFGPPRPATGRLAARRLQDVPVFPQLPGRLAAAMGQGGAHPQAEDAFFLNLWAPADARELPVVVFIHGGAWMTGGAALPWYDGARLAAQGLVVVNASYRIGALGHLGSPDAHPLPLPAADLLLALQWVREHARAFGGDPAKITLMGQSAGGWYAHLLSVLPQTRGQIHRVALLSMGTRAPWTPRQQIDATRRASQNAGGDLRHASVDQVLQAGMAALDKEPPRLGHAPSAFLPVASVAVPPALLEPDWAAGACHASAVYLRCTAHESAAFLFNAPAQRNATQAQVDEALSQWPLDDLPPELQDSGAFRGAASGLSPYRQLVAASSWRQFQRFPARYADALRRAGRAVQWSRFDTESLLDGLHSGHCFDLPFQFGNRADWSDAPMLAGFAPERFEAIARALIAEIAAFARG